MTSKVKITIITVTFGVTTPAPPGIGTTAAPAPVVTRDPSETFPDKDICYIQALIYEVLTRDIVPMGRYVLIYNPI